MHSCLYTPGELYSIYVTTNTDECDTSGEEEEIHEYQWDTDTSGDNCNVEVEDELELTEDDNHSPNISHEYDIGQASTQKTVMDGTIANPLSVDECCSDKCLEYLCKKDIEDLRSRLVTKGRQQQREIIVETLHISKSSKDEPWTKAKFEVFVSTIYCRLIISVVSDITLTC